MSTAAREHTCAEFEGGPSLWNELVAHLPGAHILQTWEWGEFKSHYGWQPARLVWRDGHGSPTAAAQVLLRSARPGRIGPDLRVAYVPRGPLLDWSNTGLRATVLADLEAYARSQRAIFIKIDPEILLGKGIPGEAGAVEEAGSRNILQELKQRGWLMSAEQIQYRNTVWLDLEGGEEDWLARMRQKTRYNVRLAERKGVSVRLGDLDDLGLLYRMYAETSVRDGFVIRSEDYYRQVWGDFHRAGMADLLIAEVDGEPVAGLILFSFGGRAWYLYGMSRDLHRDKMPNYLLQWEAMKQAKARGCRIYDLWGAPDDFNTQDSMWGVYRFKEGLGGQVIRTAGAWDYPARRILYPLYTRLLPAILSWMRRRGKERTRREVTL
jgi:lipid II:glycine glycyltransferase (peptidoglycan interpeptide bridge formation enzyme)